MRSTQSARWVPAAWVCSFSLLWCLAGASRAQTIPPEVAASAGEWPLPNKDYASTRADLTSPIDSSNVGNLAVAWTFPFASFDQPGLAFFGKVATNPLVLDGIVYLQDLESNVYAVDLTDGSLVWKVERGAPNVGPTGVAVGYGKVFALKDPKTMAALDIADGSELWAVDHTRTLYEGITIQPLVYDGRLYMSTVPGTGIGAFYKPGASGMIHALDAASGSSLWSFDTVITQPASIWGNSAVNSGGGAWYPPSVDTAAGTTYWGIGNPAPWPGTPSYHNGSSRPGANLYSNSILALDHAAGSLDWYHQAKSHDLTDADFMSTPVLATTDVGGVPTDLAIGSGKLGKVFAYDRNAGSGTPLWTTSVGVHLNDTLDPLPLVPTQVFPGVLGGVETPMAYAEDRVFVPVVNLSSMFEGDFDGVPFGSTIITSGTGELVALNADDGSEAWSVTFPTINLGGATVVNDLVLSATLDGTLYAHHRSDGSEAWRCASGAPINSIPAVAGDTFLVANHDALVALRPASVSIPDLVSQVSQPELQAHVDALATTIGPRASASARAQAVSYLSSYLGGLGYPVQLAPVAAFGLSGTNVVATRVGTSNPERTIVIGAHYDTVAASPGADDNASGVAAVLELARVLKDETFDATIEFVLFDLEEPGLVGSYQHAVDARAQGRDVDAAIVLEMVGYTCSNCETPQSFDPNPCVEVSTQGQTTGLHVWAVGNHRSEALRRRFVAGACSAPTLPVEWVKVACTGGCAPDTRRSDNARFWDEGYPAIMLTDAADHRNPNYHLPSDTPATLDMVYLRQVTQAVLATVVGAADPPGVSLPTEPDVCGSWQFTAECVDPADPSEVIQASSSYVLLDTTVDGDEIAVVGSGTPTHYLNGIHEVAITLPDDALPVRVDAGGYAAPPVGTYVQRTDFQVPFALGDPSGLCDDPKLARVDTELRVEGAVTEDDGVWRATRIEAAGTVGQLWLYDETAGQCAYVPDSPIECTTVGNRNAIVFASSPTTIEPRDGIRVTFPPASSPATLLVTELSEPDAEVPANFELFPAPGRFFDFQIDPPTIVPPVTVCFDYPDDSPDDGVVDGSFPPIAEGDLEVRHEQGGSWQDRTVSRDPVANVICAEVTSFSQLALGDAVPFTWAFYGSAQGGTLDLTVEGVALQVATTAGQSVVEVAAAVAAAIDGDPTLAAAGISAAATGNRVTTNGLVGATDVGDPGLSLFAPVHGPGPGTIALLAALLLAGGWARLRRRTLPGAGA